MLKSLTIRGGEAQCRAASLAIPIGAVGGEIVVKPQWESEIDRRNGVAKRDDQAMWAEVTMRQRIVRVFSRRANGVRETHCSNRGMRPTYESSRLSSRKKLGSDTRDGSCRSIAR